ncbi:HU family DNA-binding protein, partial [Francisella tularensis subsp. holarctica]
MNKSELVSAIANEADVTKEVASTTLEATIAAVTKALKNGDSVTL